jgi:amidohydrolase
VVARNLSPLEPAVISVTAFHAGDAFNVIADRAELRGTTRMFDPALSVQIERRMHDTISGVCDALGATFTFDYDLNTPPTVNDAGMAELVRASAVEIVGEQLVRTDDAVRTMGAEDFGEFLLEVPGCYFFVGARNESTGAVHPHHSPHFDLCEDAMPVGVAVLERAATRFLQR